MEIPAIEDDSNNFCGLAISVLNKDLALLDYFAICENIRGCGIGTKALTLIRERYIYKKFFLEIEAPDPNAVNSSERIHRKNFYKNCGMSETGINVCLFGINMELLTYNCTITFEEYHNLYHTVFGSKISDNVIQIN